MSECWICKRTENDVIIESVTLKLYRDYYDKKPNMLVGEWKWVEKDFNVCKICRLIIEYYIKWETDTLQEELHQHDH